LSDTEESARKTGQAMIWLAAIGLLAGLTWIFQLRQPGNLNREVSSYRAGGETVVKLQRDRSGHYTAAGSINGHAVHFLLDTGATDVALSSDLASELGLRFGPRVSLQTANGVVSGYMTRLDEVRLGEISLQDVRATIGPELGSGVLLGMSFLGKLDWQQNGDELLLKQSNTDKQHE
jgi:aspartyl protease family protein